ncbi:MAG: glutamate-1-semialdehyde-2,1-aminomutase [Candidatus Omnitrophica bacterium CG11_big_fil_rev_8_21_14_0_20_41_12]|nr:MAG: glutamate-1-semialdehyde-2,1-aminomutase [Candidatus Omnitrophica bacterium CG11_big_fil_rev_8_21_14_0_20_41_12]
MKNLSLKKSKVCFEQAKKFIPGGVNSPVRAFKAVGMGPLFIKKASGAYIYDVDNNKYLDYVLSWGPMILGHADKGVIKAVKQALEKGSSFGAPTEKEIELARLINQIYPSVEKVRLTSSGTESAMSALRLARGYTGRQKIIKFQGCYHGHFDSLLVEAGSGSATFGVPSSAGVNKSFAQDTISLPFNDINKVKEAVKQHKNNIACVIVEPIPANMGVILPEQGFLKGLREITRKNNIVLIFDEVITGFRVALGGAQEFLGVKPDLTILGKILGGGFPIGAFGGKREIMNLLSPDGPVYQGGTLSGNPVAVQAGITTIKLLIKNKIYDSLNELSSSLELGLKEVIRKTAVQATVQRAGSLFTLFFTDKKILKNYDDVRRCDLPRFAGFFRKMLKQGIYLAPSQFEANFISVKHAYRDIKNTLKAAESALGELKR